MPNYGRHFELYLFMSLRTSKDIMDQFTMLNANTGLCSKVRPIFLIVEMIFALRMRSGNLSKWFYI